jgi:hypothetical protein
MKRAKSDSSSTLKKKIQAKLRQKAIERDGGCILRLYPETGHCGGYSALGLILQAEHLVGRANSESYADMDNIVCICLNHHFFFKKRHGLVYWDVIKRHIGAKRWAKVKAWENDHSPHRFYIADWKRILAELNQ